MTLAIRPHRVPVTGALIGVLAFGCNSSSISVRRAPLHESSAVFPVPQGTAAAEPAPAPATPAVYFMDPSSEALTAEVEAFEASDRQTPPTPGGTLFVGSSSLRLWDDLEREFAACHALNRGFGGSRMRNVFDFADRIVIPYRPRRVFVFAGSNDIHAGVSPLQVRADFEAFVRRVWEALPGTSIAFISITSCPDRIAEIERVKEANRLIASYVAANPRLAYIDVFTTTLNPDGTPNPRDYGPEAEHPNQQADA